MTATYSIPGPGGSLGKCALCGDTFLLEILLHKKVPIVSIERIPKDLPVHEKCQDLLEKNGPDWKTLPDGPLKKAFAELNIIP